MSSLSEMPELVLENIIEFLDFRSVLTLRQVCRDFLNFIDDLNDSKLPDAEMSDIKIEAKKDKDISLTYEDCDGHEHRFIYSGAENSRKFNGKTTNLGNSNIMDVAARDLELLLKFQKDRLRYLYLHLSPSETSPVKLSNTLLNRKIKTRTLQTTTNSQSGIMSILPFADPKNLEFLDSYPRSDDMEVMDIDQIVKTEQWRNAKSIYFPFYALNLKVEDMCHFSKVKCLQMLSISARDLDFLRKTFITSSKFEYFVLQLKNFENEIIPSVWGPAFRSGPSIYWYFRIKDSEEKILSVEICQKRREVYFEITKSNDVPNGAIVHDYNEN